MSLITPFLTQMATIERYKGVSGGKPSYGDEEIVRCRTEQVTAMQLSGQMAQFTSTTRMFTEIIEAVPENSRITCEDKEYKVGQVTIAQAFGPDHLELMLI